MKPIKNKGVKIKRNDRCPCGSGLKWKQCCMLRRQQLMKRKKELNDGKQG